MGTKYARNFTIFSGEVFSTLSETKAAFSDGAIQSLKNIKFHNIENDENFDPKLQHFISTMNCRKNWSIGRCENIDILIDFV